MRARWRAIQADARWPPIHDELKRRGFDFANRTADDPDQLFYAMQELCINSLLAVQKVP